MSIAKHIWIEKLTSLKCLWLLIQRKKIIIFYISTSSLARILIKFFPKAKQIQPEGGVLDNQGRALYYKIQNGTYEYVLKIYNKLSLNEYLPNEISLFKDEWCRIYKSHIDSLIKKKLINIYFIQQQYKNNYLDKEIKVSFICESFMFDNIFYKLLNEDSDKINFTIWPDILAWSRRIFQVLKLFGLVFYSWVYNFSRFDYQNNENKAHIFEEHISNIFDRYPDAGHLFWFESSKIEPNDLVLYFNRTDQKINKKLTKEIGARKMNSLNMIHPVINTKNPFKVLINTFKDVQWFKSFSYQEIDIWLTQIKYIFMLKCFREVFKKYKCKIIHQHQEFWPNTLVMALALRMERGIFVWNHWSVDHFPISYFNWGFADIIFSWGDYNDGYFNSHDFSYKYLFQTGLIASDGNYKVSNIEKIKIKEKLSNNLDLIINILDGSYGPNHHNSKISMIYFYKELLKKIYENKNWGGIIKSKGKSFEEIINEDEIFNFLNLLKKENRIVILPSSVKVSVSANISDISVCYGINSAGIIAALSGSKSIYWDLSGCSEHPLYYLKKNGKLIFKSIDQIVKALERFDSGDELIGNHYDCLDLFDSFRDDNGRKRAGEVISSLFCDMKNNLDLEVSLNKIKKQYESKWGKKFVYKFNLGNESKGNKLWYEVQNNVKKIQ